MTGYTITEMLWLKGNNMLDILGISGKEEIWL